MRQPTMYSYMASHRYLYQIRFTPLLSHCRTWTQPFRFIIQMDQTRHDSKHSRHCKQAWMSKHNKAQAVATHAKWFQLFTVTKSGHAEEWVQLPITCIVESCLSWCSKREQERESGFISICSRVVCLPDTSEDSNESSSMSTITSLEPSSTERKHYRQTRKNSSYFTEMQHYDAWSWNERWQG